jgi:hypothetical protein
MDRSGAGGGAYLLHSSVSIRSGERKHLLFIAKLEQKDSSGELGAAGVSAAAGLNVLRLTKALDGPQARN